MTRHNTQQTKEQQHYHTMSVQKAVSQFAVKEIDASISPCCWLALCPLTCAAVPYRTTLVLDEEEVTKTDV